MQGKPSSMAYFCVGLQPELREVDRELRGAGRPGRGKMTAILWGRLRLPSPL